MLKPVYLVEFVGSRSIIWILNDLDPLHWLIRYPLLLFYWFQCIQVPHLTCGPSFRARKQLKSVYLVEIGGSRSILCSLNVWIHFIGKFDISCCFSINFSASGYLTWPVGRHFGPTKRLKSVYSVEIGGSRSILCSLYDLDPLYW